MRTLHSQLLSWRLLHKPYHHSGSPCDVLYTLYGTDNNDGSIIHDMFDFLEAIVCKWEHFALIHKSHYPIIYAASFQGMSSDASEIQKESIACHSLQLGCTLRMCSGEDSTSASNRKPYSCHNDTHLLPGLRWTRIYYNVWYFLHVYMGITQVSSFWYWYASPLLAKEELGFRRSLTCLCT